MSTGPKRNAEKLAIEERWRMQMLAAQSGDKAAYAALLHGLVGPVRRFAQKHWRDPNGVEDIVQDILLSIHSVRHTYDPDRPFGPWLMTIARRRIMDAARKSYGRKQHEIPIEVMPETLWDEGTKTDQSVSDDRADLHHALSELSPAQRQAVELTRLQGLSMDEASQIMGKSVASLKVSVHRALKNMRKTLSRKS